MNQETSDLALNPQSGSQPEMKLHIEVLRQLANTFVKQVEDLEVDQTALPDDKLNLYKEVRRFETQLICLALLHARGQQKRAARILGVKATTLNSKIKRYEIAWDLSNIQRLLLSTATNGANPQVTEVRI